MLLVLSLVPILKQQFNKLWNGKRQTNKDKKSDLLFLQRHNWYWRIWFKLTKNRQKVVQRYWCLLYGYITIKTIDDCENIYSVNPLYLIIDKVDGHIECNSAEEKNRSKYVVFDSTYENKEVLKKYTELWDRIKNEIETTNGGKEGEYCKDFMKTKFNTDHNLILNRPLKLQLLTIIVRSIFEEDSRFYPQH